MPTYRLLVAYDGAPYHGFARQKGGSGGVAAPAETDSGAPGAAIPPEKEGGSGGVAAPSETDSGAPGAAIPPKKKDLKTVQGALEDALSAVLRTPVATTGAGRTDAGVHALGQVVSFTVGEPIATTPEEFAALRRRLNGICGPTIAVLEVAEAPAGFDARFSAASRSYEYAILTREVHDPFSRHVAWHHPDPLDATVMHEAAQALVGTHDFSSFGRVPEGSTPVRNLLSISVERTEDLVLIRVSANAFIQQMVRSIVGTLVKVGEGAHPPGWVAEVLAACHRAAAGPVAPPHGLFLVEVTYPQELVRL